MAILISRSFRNQVEGALFPSSLLKRQAGWLRGAEVAMEQDVATEGKAIQFLAQWGAILQ
jgi:hypothetical protein